MIHPLTFIIIDSMKEFHLTTATCYEETRSAKASPLLKGGIS